jgi:hypothetical protein
LTGYDLRIGLNFSLEVHGGGSSSEALMRAMNGY